MNILNARKRNSNRKPETRELPFGARQSLADGELTLEQLAEGGRSFQQKNDVTGSCVGTDGNPAVEGEGHEGV